MPGFKLCNRLLAAACCLAWLAPCGPARAQTRQLFSIFDTPSPTPMPGYSPLKAYCLGEASRLAYQSADGEHSPVAATLATWGLKLVQPLHAGNTDGYVAEGFNLVVIAFRGTSSAATALQDIGLLQPPNPVWPGRVHQGFASATRDIWPQLRQVMLDHGRYINGHWKRLWLTGHSLGGAVATLAAWRLHHELGAPIEGVYTYGQPRVGDVDFARAYDQVFPMGHYRCVNDLDIVARAPLARFWREYLKYSQVGAVVYFGPDGRMILPTTRQRVNRIWDPYPVSLGEFVKAGAGMAEAIAANALHPSRMPAAIARSYTRSLTPRRILDHPSSAYVEVLYQNLPGTLRAEIPPPR